MLQLIQAEYGAITFEETHLVLFDMLWRHALAVLLADFLNTLAATKLSQHDPCRVNSTTVRNCRAYVRHQSYFEIRRTSMGPQCLSMLDLLSKRNIEKQPQPPPTTARDIFR